MNYEIYHDESNIQGYWHGMLLVPDGIKNELIQLCERSRRENRYYHKLSFKNVRKYGQVYRVASTWLSIAMGFLRSVPGNDKCWVTFRNNNYLELNKQNIGLKFILFIERDDHQKMFNYPDKTSKIETSCRIGLKGGLHYLFSDSNPVHITKIHFDGHEHYHRHLDQNRIINRMNGLREYCSIQSNDFLIDDRSSDHSSTNSQDYGDCQLLQFTDLLIGSFRSALGYYQNKYQWYLSNYAMLLIKRHLKGYARMKNSRWFHSFCMSQCYLEDNSWHFEDIDFKEGQNVNQGSFDFYI